MPVVLMAVSTTNRQVTLQEVWADPKTRKVVLVDLHQAVRVVSYFQAWYFLQGTIFDV